MAEAMYGRFVAVNVMPEHRQAFVDASILEAQTVLSEEAEVFEFQILVDVENPNRFYFYEVLRDEATLRDLRETEAFERWLGVVQPMLDGEIETLARMRSLFPSAKGFEAQKPSLLLW